MRAILRNARWIAAFDSFPMISNLLKSKSLKQINNKTVYFFESGFNRYNSLLITANLQLDLEAGKVRWLYNDLAGENNFTVVTNAVVATDEWVHIAATYNATTKEAKVFINAKEMGVNSQIESTYTLLKSFYNSNYSTLF